MLEEVKYKWSPKTWARITGLIGIVVLICGSYTHSINSTIIDYNNAVQTSENFLSS